jgi:hypothetical protein
MEALMPPVLFGGNDQGLLSLGWQIDLAGLIYIGWQGIRAGWWQPWL